MDGMFSIYETLSGRQLNGKELSEYPTMNDRLASIHDHLVRLLNARQGVLGHLPDYGLPDVNRYYQNLPYTAEDLARAVKEIIEKYEPRLESVEVVHLPRDMTLAIVHLEISGTVVGGGDVRFQTLFKSSGQAEVMNTTGDDSQ